MNLAELSMIKGWEIKDSIVADDTKEQLVQEVKRKIGCLSLDKGNEA